MASRRRGLALLAAVCCLASCRAPAGRPRAQPLVGHLEIWITPPAAGPFVSPLIWLNGPQLGLGEAARQLGLTGGRSGQGHGLVRLARYEPPTSLWVEQLGGKAWGTTGYPADHYPSLKQLQSTKRYGHRRIYTVFLLGLTARDYGTVHQFLADLGERYDRYSYGHPNCADLCAESWNLVAERKTPRGPFWFPFDLAAHALNLPGKLHPKLRLLGQLRPIPWRNRTPDQVARRLRRLGAVRLRHRAVGDVTFDEARRLLTAPPREARR